MYSYKKYCVRRIILLRVDAAFVKIMEEVMEYIVVVGAKMSNTGSQSMVFQIVGEMHKRFPNKKVVALMNHKRALVENMNEIYNFEIISFCPADILYLYGGIQNVAGRMLGVSKKNINHIKAVLQNTCLAFDVSGYSLSSNWSGANSLKYLYQIAILKKYQIPIVIMPQSFGPFEYGVVFKQYINRLGKKLLPYPNIIFAREKYSYHIVRKQFGLNNVAISMDMVLLGKEVDQSILLKPTIKLREYSIQEGCIAVVPNNKLAEKFSLEAALEIYVSAINYLTECKKKVYIVQHSETDRNLCNKLAAKFHTNKDITLLQANLSCLEYDLLIRHFDFIIASRYHALVHAYKQKVPCIAIGWSEKYNNLLDILKQDRYMIDAKKFNKEELFKKIDIMLQNYDVEHMQIQRFFENMDEDLYQMIFRQIEIKE